MKLPGFLSVSFLLRTLGLCAALLVGQAAAAQTGGTIGFAPVQSLYTANPNYLATNSWGNWTVNGVTARVLSLWTPNPRSDGVCPDGTNNYYGDAAKMTGLNIPVTPNTNYTIQAYIWILNQTKGTGAAINVNPALSFRVNGQVVTMNSFPLDTWTTVTGTWNSGSATTVTSIGIWNNQGAGCGNDYFILGAPSQVTPSIAVTKTVSADPLAAGATGTFTIHIAISGGTTTTPISLTDALPAGLTLSAAPSLLTASTTSAGASLTCTSGAGATTVSCTVASGADSGSIAISVPVNISSSTASRITNTASLSGGTANCTGTPCQGSVSVDVSPPAGAKLTISKITTSGTGSFTFNGAAPNANGFGSNYAITTTAPNTRTPGAQVTLTATNTQTDVQEVAQTSWVLTGATCSDRNAAATGNPASFGTLSNSKLTIPATNVRPGSDLLCTFTNAPKRPILGLTQTVIVLAPGVFNPPVPFVYDGNNGWTQQTLKSTLLAPAKLVGSTQTLAAVNTDTTLSVTLPAEGRWRILSIKCADTNAAVSGNASGTLVSSATTTVTLLATLVKPAAVFACDVLALRN